MFAVRPIPFEKLCRICQAGLGCKAGSLIRQAVGGVSVYKVLPGNDVRLFFTVRGNWFRLQKWQCLPVSFRQSNYSSMQ